MVASIGGSFIKDSPSSLYTLIPSPIWDRRGEIPALPGAHPLTERGWALPASYKKRVPCQGAGASLQSPPGSGGPWVWGQGLRLPCPASLPLGAEPSHPGKEQIAVARTLLCVRLEVPINGSVWQGPHCPPHGGGRLPGPSPLLLLRSIEYSIDGGGKACRHLLPPNFPRDLSRGGMWVTPPCPLLTLRQREHRPQKFPHLPSQPQAIINTK